MKKILRFFDRLEMHLMYETEKDQWGELRFVSAKECSRLIRCIVVFLRFARWPLVKYLADEHTVTDPRLFFYGCSFK